MFQKSIALFLTCETPLHAGSGDSLGIVDMPIQRERHTSFPKIEASSLKGSLREAFEGLHLETNPKRDHPDILKTFGPDSDGSEHAGAIGFTDARLLLFPVKSMKGVFAWITCPKVLHQFAEDMKLAVKLEVSNIPSVSDGEAVPLGEDQLTIGCNYVLEEYTFKKKEKAKSELDHKEIAHWLADHLFNSRSYCNDKAKKDILVLSDNDFKDFVNLSTEVITRTKIDNNTGTVQGGALFTEEYLPAESVLYSIVLASPEFVSKGHTRNQDVDDLMKIFTNGINGLPVIQLGGNATLGKGILRTKFVEPTKSENHG